MLDYLESADRDPVVAASLARLLAGSEDERVGPALAALIESDPDPLVRAAAAAASTAHLTTETGAALLAAIDDDFRLVRLAAAGALGAYPEPLLDPEDRRRLERASAELAASLLSRPDDAQSHYNLGNFYMSRGDLGQALVALETALRVEPDHVPSLINISLVRARLAHTVEAEVALRRALELEPANADAHFNLGILLGERGAIDEATAHLGAAWEVNPQLAEAAYNACVLLAAERIDDAVEWCRRASDSRPDEPVYAYTLAFYLREAGAAAEAARILERLIDDHAAYGDGYRLLGAVYEEGGEVVRAVALYRRALADVDLAESDRSYFAARLEELTSP
jgi:tetratricopeptide (TPR) repeat protein